jgi:hypothetical protein
MPNTESVVRDVTGKSASFATFSSRRSTPAVSAPSGSASSFCHVSWSCVVRNG